MKLIDVLEARHDSAVKAAYIRDCSEACRLLEKTAQEKGAGFADRVGKLIELAKRPFTSPSDRLRGAVLGKVHGTILDMLHAIPKDEAARRTWMTENTIEEIEKTVSKVIDGGQAVVEKRTEQSVQPPPGMKHMSELLKLTDALKEDSKLPMRAMLGLAGAFGLGATGMAELDRITTEKAHKENFSTIMQDTNIPLSLKPRAKDMYQVLVRYAPSIAKDPVFSRDFTKNLIRHEAVDHKVVADLISAEKAYQESKGRRGEFLQAMGGLALRAGGV